MAVSDDVRAAVFSKLIFVRAHIIKDLEPYVCVLPGCRNDDEDDDEVQTFWSTASWLDHMRLSHGKIWECSAKGHSTLTFQDQEQYDLHQITDHGVDDGHLMGLRRLAERPANEPIRNCLFMGPMCVEVESNSHSHYAFAAESVERCVAYHLKEVALLALPSLHNLEDELEDAESVTAEEGRGNGHRLSMLSLMEAVSFSGTRDQEAPLSDDTQFQQTEPPLYEEDWSFIHEVKDVDHTSQDEDRHKEAAYLQPHKESQSEHSFVSKETIAKRRTFVNSLEFAQMNNQFNSVAEPTPNTCIWVTKTTEFQTWLYEAESPFHSGLFCIFGKPGSGKSVLMKSAFTQIRSDMPDVINTCLFFNNKDPDLSISHIGMYRSLLWQLLRQIPDLQDVLDFVSDIDSLFDAGFLQQLLRRAFTRLRRNRIFCWIDGIDACEQVHSVLDFLNDVCERATFTGSWLRICVSSRHYPFLRLPPRVSLILEDCQEHQSDIATYLQANLVTPDNLEFTKVKDAILIRSSGIFLWVVEMVKLLNDDYDRRSPFGTKRLDERSAEVNRLYHIIWGKRTGEAPERSSVIMCMLCALRPLDLKELYFAVVSRSTVIFGSDFSRRSDEMTSGLMRRSILSWSQGLVEVSQTEDTTTSFIHSTVRDFFIESFEELLSPRDRLTPTPSFVLGVCHDRFKESCRNYLSRVFLAKFQNPGYSGPNDLLKLGWTEDRIVSYFSSTFPLLKYAVENVLKHSEMAAKSGISQLKFIEEEFSFQAWVTLGNIFHLGSQIQYWSEASRLHFLIKSGAAKLTLIELSKVQYIDVRSQHHESPLHTAIRSEQRSCLGALLLPDLRPLRKTANDDLEEVPDFPTIKVGTVIDILLKHKERILRDSDGTPLMWACKRGETNVTKCLLATRKVSLDHRDAIGNSAICLAVKHGHDHLVEMLRKAGAEPWSDTTAYETDSK